jgi:solute carrier family 25 carnitine/acylcarnitine transporter 20/29
VARALDLAPGAPLPVWGAALAGGSAGLATSLVQGPADLGKTKMQRQSMRRLLGARAAPAPPGEPEYAGSIDCLRRTWRTYGARGWLQGQSATTARNVVATFSYFGAYEALKRAWAPPGAPPPVSVALAAGGLAGVAYWVSAYPLDVVKSRMQGDAADPAARTYRSLVQSTRAVWAAEGAAAFYRGLVPTLYRAVICNALTFAGYEAVKARVAPAAL